MHVRRLRPPEPSPVPIGVGQGGLEQLRRDLAATTAMIGAYRATCAAGLAALENKAEVLRSRLRMLGGAWGEQP